MMRAFQMTLAAGAALAALSGAALAADLDSPIFIEQAPEVVPVEIGNGWYLRGDVGFVVTESAGPFDFRVFDPVAGTYADSAFATQGFSQEHSYGLGVGYQFNQWMRADATVDWFNGDFTGTTVSAQPCSTDPTYAGTSCRTADAQSMTAYTLLANAYVDLGTIAHITPYVGAGAGYSLVNYGDLTNTLACVPGVGPAVCPAPNPVGTITHAGIDEYRFTYALMAGATYDVSKNLKVDLGYKYTKIAGGDTFAFDAASQGAGASGTQGTDEGFERHDVRVGVRYSLW